MTQNPIILLSDCYSYLLQYLSIDIIAVMSER